MPIPSAAELTDPNATNTQMKQRLGQLAENVESKESSTEKANTAKNEAIVAASTDATAKADAAEANAKNYTDIATEPKLLSGLDIYYQAKENPSKSFQAIWQEYNKPVYHLGNSVVVDTTGAVLKTIEEELVFTIKLTAANETFIYPTRANIIAGQNAVIDWGDGIITEHSNYLMNHTYVGNIGDEFQIKVKGNPLMFDFGATNGGRRTSRLMLKSIDKNTMPKTMQYFSVTGCTNLQYLNRYALSSYTGLIENWNLCSNCPNLVLHKDALKGLEHVTSITGLLSNTSVDMSYDLPVGIFDNLVNVVSAKALFRRLVKPLPVGILDKLINLEDVSDMFYVATITSIDNRIFKNQTKLKNTSMSFRGCTNLTADAKVLYDDMVRGNPTVVNATFYTSPNMQNLAQVPAGWKAL